MTKKTSSNKPAHERLSSRERQIMDIMYTKKEASALDIQKELSDPPSYSAVRTFLKILENKGFVEHKKEGLKYIYTPAIGIKTAMKEEVRRIMGIFFDDSVPEALEALITIYKRRLKEEDFEQMQEIIKTAK